MASTINHPDHSLLTKVYAQDKMLEPGGIKYENILQQEQLLVLKPVTMASTINRPDHSLLSKSACPGQNA